MSRLIFRNLPSDLTSSKFTSQLTTPPTLSDITITDTKYVPKRRFAFVGYKSEEDALKAKEWFDGSHTFGAGKIKVEIVRDEPLSQRPTKKQKIEVTGSSKRADESDDKVEPVAGPSKGLKEFMEVMKGDDGIGESSSSKNASKQHTRKESRKGKEKSIEPKVAKDDEELDDDAAWLAKRQSAMQSTDPATTHEGHSQVHVDPEEALILSTGRLFLRNLPFVTTSSDLSSLFSQYGKLEEVHLPMTSKGEPLGTAFILFHESSDAVNAWKNLDKKTFQGRLLHILPGRAKPGQELRSGLEGGVQKKQGEDGKQVLGKIKETREVVQGKKEEKRKEVNSRGVSWASLYMNSDAVAASIASKMGISKSDLLNSEEGDAAVKLALAETSVIQDTKTYFQQNGIDLDSLKLNVPRSQTILLVKNIPFGTSIQTLKDLFEPFGKLQKVLMPPSGTLGVVEFENATECSKAFKGLSYKRLGSSVLYLEKGPKGMFTSNASQTNGQSEKNDSEILQDRVKALDDPSEKEKTDQPSESDEHGSTLFLKNLSFVTTSEKLISTLKSLPDFSFARVQTKPDPKNPGFTLSMGYGFVGFKTQNAAKKALKALEGFTIDEKIIEPKFAMRGNEPEAPEGQKGAVNGRNGLLSGSKTKSTKVLIKNIPFEATKSDLKTLLSAYGSLKSLRLPKKSTLTVNGNKSARGFAFAEFMTHQDALRVMEALKHTHLLGRHLVLEWAKEGASGEDVERLREKVKGEVKGMEEWEGRIKGKRKLDMTSKAQEELDGLEV